MKKFEYNTLTIDAKGVWGGKVAEENFKQKLNEMGQNGWELVGMTNSNQAYGQTRYIICTFKREIE